MIDAVINKQEIPENWLLVPLKEFRGKTAKSINPANSPDEVFELYSVPSFSDGSPEFIQGDEIGSSKRLIEPNTVLLSKINPRINRVWIVGEVSKHRQISSPEWIEFFPSKLVYPKYLMYFMQNQKFREHLCMNVSGVGGSLTRVRPKVAEDYELPLAPLEQQKRIVAKIEELFSHIDAGIAALNKAKQLLKQYRQSVLKAAVTGELTKQWREDNKDKLEPASQLLERILEERRRKWEVQQLEQFKAKGKVPKDDKWKGKYKEPLGVSPDALCEVPEGWHLVTLDQISGLISGQHINSSDYTDIEGEAEYAYLTGPSDFGVLNPVVKKWTNTLKAVAQKNDVLITVKGSGVGKTNLLNQDDVVISRQLMALRPNIDEWYVYIFLLGKFDQLQSASTGTAIPGIGRDTILSMVLALPPIEEQAQIKMEFERLQSIIEKTEKSIEYQKKKSSAEKQSILAAAFSGELVETFESDGSAQELLERIRKQHLLNAAKEKLTNKRGTAKKKGEPMGKKKIIDVLKATGKALSPEKLFDLIGADGTSPDDVEGFYIELKEALSDKNVVIEAVTDNDIKKGDLISYREEV